MNHSWTKISNEIVEKRLDRSAFMHGETGIPIDIRSTVGADSLGVGDTIPVTLNYGTTRYEAKLRRRRPGGQTSLSWDRPFSHLLRELYPNHFQGYESGSPLKARPTMRLQRSRSSEFIVTFRLDKQPEGLDIEALPSLTVGYEVSADDVAQLSGQNRIKGIHIVEDGEPRCVIILCTIGGKYKNKWLNNEHTRLKYYLEGRKKKGTEIRVYNPNIKSNQAVINSYHDDYPLYVFVRYSQSETFKYSGVYIYDQVVGTKTDMYFDLIRDVADFDPDEVDSIIHDDTHDDPVYFGIEGKQRIRQHLVRERDYKIIREVKRLAKKRHGKLVCQACGFDFAEWYGERGQDYVEGHHTIPIEDLDPASGEESRPEDIALLCANCHRIVHCRRPWLSMEQLKSILKNSRASIHELTNDPPTL